MQRSCGTESPAGRCWPHFARTQLCARRILRYGLLWPSNYSRPLPATIATMTHSAHQLLRYGSELRLAEPRKLVFHHQAGLEQRAAAQGHDTQTGTWAGGAGLCARPQHPRWLHVLPNGDALVAEAATEPMPSWSPRAIIENWVQRRSGPSLRMPTVFRCCATATRTASRSSIRCCWRVCGNLSAWRSSAISFTWRTPTASCGFPIVPVTCASPPRAPNSWICLSDTTGPELCWRAPTAPSFT